MIYIIRDEINSPLSIVFRIASFPSIRKREVSGFSMLSEKAERPQKYSRRPPSSFRELACIQIQQRVAVDSMGVLMRIHVPSRQYVPSTDPYKKAIQIIEVSYPLKGLLGHHWALTCIYY